jgi:hypothetical protein
MSGTSPDFNYWSTRPTLQVWFVAAMMHGVDPRAMADVTDSNGDDLDISDDIQLLISASLVGAIEAYPLAGHNPDKHTELSKASLETWLRTRGYADLADALVPPVGSASSPLPGESKIARQDRRLQQCIDASLDMGIPASGRLPDGIAAVAAAEGISRQSFSEDVKAAIARRDMSNKPSIKIHRI